MRKDVPRGVVYEGALSLRRDRVSGLTRPPGWQVVVVLMSPNSERTGHVLGVQTSGTNAQRLLSLLSFPPSRAQRSRHRLDREKPGEESRPSQRRYGHLPATPPHGASETPNESPTRPALRTRPLPSGCGSRQHGLRGGSATRQLWGVGRVAQQH